MTAHWKSLPAHAAIIVASLQAAPAAPATEPLQISGVYPHLAVFTTISKRNGANVYTDVRYVGETGIGTVVPWTGKLWFTTYPIGGRRGSDDKLYSVDTNLMLTIQPESVGGCIAGRLPI